MWSGPTSLGILCLMSDQNPQLKFEFLGGEESLASSLSFLKQGRTSIKKKCTYYLDGQMNDPQ